jgi:hypothetical protein
MRCRACGAGLQSLGNRNWLYPLGLVAIIGVTFALLHQAASPIEYRCTACGLRFARRSTAGRAALLAMSSIVGLIILLLLVSSRR